MAKKKLKDFEMMTMDSESLIEELKREIAKKKYDIDYIKLLLEFGHFDVNDNLNDYYDDEITTTFLQIASELGRVDIVKVLLEFGANPNTEDIAGWTPLIKASECGHTQVVKELLQHPDINPNSENSFGMNALMTALDGGHSQIIKEILNHPDINITILNDDYCDFIESLYSDNLEIYYNTRQKLFDINVKYIKETETLKTLLKEISTELPENSKNLQKIQDLLS